VSTIPTIEETTTRNDTSTSAKRERSPKRLDLLVVVDSSDASTRALEYLGEFFSRRTDVHFCLTYLTPKVPASLLESGGAEQPQREEQIERALRKGQDEWMTSEEPVADRAISDARAILNRAGVHADAIGTCEMSPLDNCSSAEELLLVARQQQCWTIVVGHSAHSWFHSLGGTHLADQLVTEAKDIAVWVID
jgi:nucleotide-binding universal stress UspA family protein